MRHLLAAAALGLAFAATGCQTVYDGRLDTSSARAGVAMRTIVLLPLDNATTDPAAGRALRDFTASALAERGIRFRQTEEALILAAKKNVATESGLYPELARLTGARYFITGTVHEYRYMSDLEGSPAVGYSIRLIDARDGRTLWVGTAANTGYGWQSLSELCADSSRRLAGRIPIVMRDENEPPRVCLRTGKPAHYTPTGVADRYEVDTVDGSLAYTVEIKDGKLPPLYTEAPTPPPAPASAPVTQPVAAPITQPVAASVAQPAPATPTAPVVAQPVAAQPLPVAPEAAPGERNIR